MVVNKKMSYLAREVLNSNYQLSAPPVTQVGLVLFLPFLG